jgi:hypothetical protein
LARFSAPFFSVLPDLFVAGDDAREIHSLAPGVATKPSASHENWPAPWRGIATPASPAAADETAKRKIAPALPCAGSHR